MALSPLERFYLACMRKEPDQVPPAIVTGIPFFTDYLGLSISETYFKPENLLKAQLAVIKRWGKDAIIMAGAYPDNTFVGLFPQFHAFGCKIKFTDTSPGYPYPIIKSVDELPKFVENLTVPDMERDEYCQESLKQLEWYMKNVPEEVRYSQWSVQNTACIMGPSDSAAFILGSTSLLPAVKLYPDEVKEAMKVFEEACIKWIDMIEQVVGSIKRLLVECHQLGFMKTEDFIEIFAPSERAVMSCRPKALVMHHGEADIRQNLDAYAALADVVDVWHTAPELDIGVIKRLYGDKIALIGNLDTTKVLTQGTRETIYEAVKNVIKKAGPGGGLILSTGGGTFCGKNWQNIDFMIEATKKYGTYPIEIED